MGRPFLLALPLALATVLGACGHDFFGVDEVDWRVSGVVILDGAPVGGVTVRLTTSLLADAFPATSRPDGTFVIRATTCRTPYLGLGDRRFRLDFITGFVQGHGPGCPSPLSGVHVYVSRYPPLELLTTALVDGAVALDYDQPLLASGGVSPYGWRLESGSLPPGLVLQDDRILGTPTAAGSFSFTVGVTSWDLQHLEGGVTVEILDGAVVGPLESCDGRPSDAFLGFASSEIARRVGAGAGLDPTALVTCADAARVTELDASYADAHDVDGLPGLSGLQNLSSLVWLDLSGNPVVSLAPLQGLTSLVALNLDYTGATDVTHLAGLTSLRRLEISDVGLWYSPPLDIAPLGALTGLTVLDISVGRADDLTALSGLTQLDTLRASVNQIDDVSALSGMSGLRWLELSNNGITSVEPLSGLTALEGLDLDWNPVEDLSPLSGMTAMRRLGLNLPQQGGVGGIEPLAGMTQLEEVRLVRRVVPDTSPLNGLLSLTSLVIWAGKIPTLELAHLPSLNRVLASGDSIAAVSLTDLLSLVELDLSGNLISDISGFQELTALEVLELGGNDIVDIGPLADITSLRVLSLWGNQDLADIQPLLDNTGLGGGDTVDLSGTMVSCTSIQALRARGVVVFPSCDP
jgi:Leucine-rich repeat (LRR) protein